MIKNLFKKRGIKIAIASTACSVCGRVLKNKDSIARGMGPECGRGYKSSIRQTEKDTPDMFNPEFDYRIRGKLIVIRDLNRGSKSVTNDMENVLMRISMENPGKVNYESMIVYLDSEGIFDGVAITNHNTNLDPKELILTSCEIQFFPIRAKTEAEVLEFFKISRKTEAKQIDGAAN